MKSNFKQMLSVGGVAGLLAIGAISPVYAATVDDGSAPATNACMFKVETGNGSIRINTLYVRTLQVVPDDDSKNAINSTLKISLASNLYTNISQVKIKYATNEIAENAADTIADRITFCREQAQIRKANKTNKVNKPN